MHTNIVRKCLSNYNLSIFNNDVVINVNVLLIS